MAANVANVHSAVALGTAWSWTTVHASHKQQDGNRHARCWGYPPSIAGRRQPASAGPGLAPTARTTRAGLGAGAVGNEFEASRNCPVLTAVVDPDEFPSPGCLVPPELDGVKGRPLA
ncbi:hypothetical protein ACFFX0_25355 [Citricoccus parietis]|uniref:Uncharacterized protein n=1 Tax=Citricoccus parietis TaxID=592307 RepID=A0ABV5G5X8_9MICC